MVSLLNTAIKCSALVETLLLAAHQASQRVEERKQGAEMMLSNWRQIHPCVLIGSDSGRVLHFSKLFP